MSNKRSYLNSLNAGRQRRPHTTLEQLNHSLSALEERLEQSREEAASHVATSSNAVMPRYPSAHPYDDDKPLQAPRTMATERNREPVRNAQSAPTPDRNYQTIARDIDQLRGREDGIAMFGKIAGELRGLRGEMQHQLTAGLHREFEALRKDVEKAYTSGAQAKGSAELGVEFERLSDSIQSLAEKNDDRGVNMLRLELEQVKAAIDTLASNDSVRAVDRRWDDFDRRWTAFEDRIGNNEVRSSDDVGIAKLTERLEQIGNAVNNLPESLSLRSLEEKVRTLAGAVDHFAGQQTNRGSETFGVLDERLDEISRAIVASTVAAQANTFDPETFNRIESRIASLAQQIEEVAEDRPSGEVIDRLNTLSSRVDVLAARGQLPEQAMERLAGQISLIAEKIDHAPAMPDADYIFQGLDQRFDVLSGMMERRQGDAIEQGNMLFRDLEQRLDEVVDRLDKNMSHEPVDNVGIMDAMDARFSALAARLEPRGDNSDGQAAIRSLETRLDDISNRLDMSATQFAGIDPDLIRSLEAQVSGLSAHLSQPGVPLPAFEDIGPRLSQIESSISGTRETILEAAREAAESAVRSMADSNANTAAVSGLAEDLKTLESLTRRSDDRNSRTFEAIHDTLLKIVDRLGTLETGGTDDAEESLPSLSTKIAVEHAPKLDMDEPLPMPQDGGDDEEIVATTKYRELTDRTPTQAASEAAKAALHAGRAADNEEPENRKSIFSGLSRAFKSNKDAEAPVLAGSTESIEAPTVELDEVLEPAQINRPLEPGSGAPDLNAIMKRVRDERGQTARTSDTDAAKSDFIAAARRAAQAAAAEAETLKRQSTISGPVKALRIGDLLKARRKPILMAAGAIMLALAGLQLGKAFLSDPVQVASNDEAPKLAQEVAQAGAVNAPQPETSTPSASETPAARSAEQVQPIEGETKDNMVADSGTSGTAAVGVAASDQPNEPMSMQPYSAASTSEDVADATPDTLKQSDKVVPSTEPTVAKIDIPSEVGSTALRDAAASGDAKALFEIGSRYAEARGVKEDMAKAANWYEKAANIGFAPAEYRIGNFYEKGLGVKRDIQKAKTWYQLAAEQGNASAMHNLAVLFAMAMDGAADNEGAARWFQAAADLGVKDSQFNLGILAAKGVGMPQNLEESYKWFALVAKSGDKDAAAKRDEIANALRPEQLQRARAATELWKAKPLDPAVNSIEIPADWQDVPTTTASVDMKKAIKNIQLILNKNGYAAGAADGVMGAKTKDAIIAFQTNNNMDPTGSVDESLVKALLARK